MSLPSAVLVWLLPPQHILTVCGLAGNPAPLQPTSSTHPGFYAYSNKLRVQFQEQWVQLWLLLPVEAEGGELEVQCTQLSLPYATSSVLHV